MKSTLAIARLRKDLSRGVFAFGAETSDVGRLVFSPILSTIRDAGGLVVDDDGRYLPNLVYTLHRLGRLDDLTVLSVDTSLPVGFFKDPDNTASPVFALPALHLGGPSEVDLLTGLDLEAAPGAVHDLLQSHIGEVYPVEGDLVWFPWKREGFTLTSAAKRLTIPLPRRLELIDAAVFPPRTRLEPRHYISRALRSGLAVPGLRELLLEPANRNFAECYFQRKIFAWVTQPKSAHSFPVSRILIRQFRTTIQQLMVCEHAGANPVVCVLPRAESFVCAGDPWMQPGALAAARCYDLFGCKACAEPCAMQTSAKVGLRFFVGNDDATVRRHEEHALQTACLESDDTEGNVRVIGGRRNGGYWTKRLDLPPPPRAEEEQLALRHYWARQTEILISNQTR